MQLYVSIPNDLSKPPHACEDDNDDTELGLGDKPLQIDTAGVNLHDLTCRVAGGVAAGEGVQKERKGERDVDLQADPQAA